MIKFDPALVTIEIVRLKSVSTAVGGSIQIVDEDKSTDVKEVQKRIPVSTEVARSFIKHAGKITKWLKPTYAALVKYNNSIIAMERHPLSSLGELETEGVFGPTRWIPYCEHNFNNFVKPLLAKSGQQWYFDGRYMYSFATPDLGTAVRESEFLTRDGSFRKTSATTLDVHHLSNASGIELSGRSCVAFVTSAGNGVVSPPIWKNISNVGVSAMRGHKDEDEDDESADTLTGEYSFSDIDATLSVNLEFALKAGNDVGQMFGYEMIEPLQLPRLMVELCTVNLPNMPREIRATYDIGMSFTHAMSWMLGMMSKAKTLEHYVSMRNVMKFLTKRGIFRKNTFAHDRMFKPGMSITDIPMMSLSELVAQENVVSPSLSSIVSTAALDAVMLISGPTSVDFELLAA